MRIRRQFGNEHSPSFKVTRAFIGGILHEIRSGRQTLQRKSLFFPGQPVLNSSVFPMSGKPKPREAELSFESAMDGLEKIVEQMESGKLPLEDLIVRYEEGMKLVKTCQERLAKAEQKIEIIARNSTGKTIVKDFEPTPEPAAPTEGVD